MCRRFVLSFFLSVSALYGAVGQLVHPEVMDIWVLDVEPLHVKDPVFPVDLSFLNRPLGNTHIENPAIRYAMENINQSERTDWELDNALNVLMDYAKNDTLKGMVEYIRKYVANTAANEAALGVVDARVAADTATLDTLSTEPDSDVRTFVTYISADSNYVWLRKVSRDSVWIEISNLSDDTTRFWINNGRKEVHRFWAINKMGDSIGTWIQAAPPGNSIRLYVDDDVTRTQMNAKKMAAKELPNERTKDSYSLGTVSPNELHRRYWTYYSEVELSVGQGAVVNWSSGGENSLSVLSNLRYYWNYNKNKTSWENFVHYRLGFLKSGEQNMRKNEEKLELNSKLGQKAFAHWFYTSQLNIQTTILNSYEYSGDSDKKKIGNFMTPGYFKLSVGMDYKPKDNFSLYLSPIAGKLIYLRDTTGIDPGRYGVDKDKKTKVDAGASIELRNKFKMFDFMDVRNELVLFASYTDPDCRYTGNWQLQLDFKINYFMQASVYTNIVFDENFSKKLQYKESLNLGVKFRF